MILNDELNKGLVGLYRFQPENLVVYLTSF